MKGKNVIRDSCLVVSGSRLDGLLPKHCLDRGSRSI